LQKRQSASIFRTVSFLVLMYSIIIQSIYMASQNDALFFARKAIWIIFINCQHIRQYFSTAWHPIHHKQPVHQTMNDSLCLLLVIPIRRYNGQEYDRCHFQIRHLNFHCGNFRYAIPFGKRIDQCSARNNCADYMTATPNHFIPSI
jgi:hypothetical protein